MPHTHVLLGDGGGGGRAGEHGALARVRAAAIKRGVEAVPRYVNIYVRRYRSFALLRSATAGSKREG